MVTFLESRNVRSTFFNILAVPAFAPDLWPTNAALPMPGSPAVQGESWGVLWVLGYVEACH